MNVAIMRWEVRVNQSPCIKARRVTSPYWVEFSRLCKGNLYANNFEY